MEEQEDEEGEEEKEEQEQEEAQKQPAAVVGGANGLEGYRVRVIGFPVPFRHSYGNIVIVFMLGGKPCS